MITLYDMALSGNCHKVRLLLGCLQLPYQIDAVDLRNGEQRSAEYLQRNPFGQVPVLEDNAVLVRDSQAILVYLAKRYGGAQWWPEEAETLSQITAWLSTAANEIAHGPARLRLHHKFGAAIDTALAQQTSDKVLAILDRHLASHNWLVGNAISIADIAIYPYVALAPEGKVDLTRYANIVAWCQRIQATPGYVAMPGLWQA